MRPYRCFSDLQFRGYSLSEGQQVAILDFAYDQPSGFYADVSGTGVLRDGGPAPLGLQLTGGYARRLKSGTTLDFGLTQSTYSNYSSAARGNSYAEVYAGIARGALSSRLFLSPHYFERGRWSAYGELNASVSPRTAGTSTAMSASMCRSALPRARAIGPRSTGGSA